MTDTKPDDYAEMVEFRDGECVWLRPAPPRACGACGAKLFPGDWLTRDGCTYCDAGVDLLTPWGAT